MYLACSVNLQDKLSYQYSHHLFRAHVPANVNASLHSVEYWKTLKKNKWGYWHDGFWAHL